MALQQVAAEAGRDIDGEFELAGAQAPIDLDIIVQACLPLRRVGRAGTQRRELNLD